MRTKSLGVFHDGTAILGEVVYSSIRALAPGVVVETGVAHGVTSYYALSALERNGDGMLYSIDLPPLVGPEALEHVGAFVPAEVRSRWRLLNGNSRGLLGPLCQELRELNLFVHDSLHTYSTMMFELTTALRVLGRPGIVIADDVHRNRAFDCFVEASAPMYHAVLDRPDGGQVGFCMFL